MMEDKIEEVVAEEPENDFRYDVRRSGSGRYYIVMLNENGISSNVYVDGKLLDFKNLAGAKKYIHKFGGA